MHCRRSPSTSNCSSGSVLRRETNWEGRRSRASLRASFRNYFASNCLFLSNVKCLECASQWALIPAKKSIEMHVSVSKKTILYSILLKNMIIDLFRSERSRGGEDCCWARIVSRFPLRPLPPRARIDNCRGEFEAVPYQVSSWCLVALSLVGVFVFSRLSARRSL